MLDIPTAFLTPLNLQMKIPTKLTLAALLACPAINAQVIVDGTRDVAEGYTELATQTVASNWGDGNYLANLHAQQDGGNLNLSLASSAVDNAVIIFIDSKPGGVNFIANNLITSGGEESTINNFGSSATEGLTFEDGFEADYAIRIYGNGTQDAAFVNLYNLQTGVRSFIGESTTAPQSGGIISSISTFYTDLFGTAPDDYGALVDGIEMALSLGSMGVPAGEQEVKFTAILVNNNTTFASNQLLGSRTGVTDDIGNTLNSIDLETEPGTQTLSFTVLNNDNDGDGNPDDTDPDDDNDGLPDTVEDGGGFFIDANQTGTDPLVADTDGDGFKDGDEVNNTSTLGYQSDPNVPNFEFMTVPGTFNQPAEFTATPGANDPSTDMVQLDTSDLSDQYVWQLDYQFLTAQQIRFKFAAGSFEDNWGADTATTVTPNGPDIDAEVTASGIHRFIFDQAVLTYSFERVNFASESEFLTAYGLDADPDGDADSDNILNKDEFLTDTDPTNADTDGDGINDDVDPEPLQAGSRDITFSVNTRVIQKLGLFDPTTDSIRVVGNFWNNFSVADGPVLTDADEDGIYEITISASGRPGDFFGEYKFNSDSPNLPAEWNGFEQGGNRNFIFEEADTAQVLPTVYFNTANLNGNGIYFEWADDFGLDLSLASSDPSANFDGDGSTNREEFYFGGNPAVVDTLPFAFGNDGFDIVVQWLERGDVGITYELQESANLSNWLPSASPSFEAFDQTGVPFGYSRREAFIPINDGPNFIQVEAIGNVPDPEEMVVPNPSDG